jgi:hypothetical protein
LSLEINFENKKMVSWEQKYSEVKPTFNQNAVGMGDITGG